MSVLGDDELRFQRYDTVVSGRDNRRREHGVEILDLVLAAFTMGTVRTMDLVGAVEFRSIQRDQRMPIQAAHGVQAAARSKLGHDIGEHGMEHGWFDGVELGANLAVAGDFADTKHCLAVRTDLVGLQMALMSQKRRGLHDMKNGANAARAKSAMS
jgi:hypothetical protein